jgi:F-type H+-transporting ATPase subunit b
MMRLSLSAALLLLAAPASAASEGGSSDFGWQVFNFVLLVVVLLVVTRKPIQSYLEDRRNGIMTSLSEAAALQREAEENYSRWQRQLVELDQRIDEIRSTAAARAERESTQILTDARATAERIKRDATAAIESELRRAQARLRAETSELAIELAAGILREQVNDADRDRLLDEFISRIEKAPGADASKGSSI